MSNITTFRTNLNVTQIISGSSVDLHISKKVQQ